MNFDMTYQQALDIQWEQIAYYRRRLGRKGVKSLRAMTAKCPADIHPGKPTSIFVINDLVPRGGSIEFLISNNNNARGRK